MDDLSTVAQPSAYWLGISICESKFLVVFIFSANQDDFMSRFLAKCDFMRKK
jgi:hypothetical protein